MKSIIKIIKGGLVGIGNSLPGISGSMIAVIINIYQELIDAVNNIFTHPIQAIKSVWTYAVGAIIGIALGFIISVYLLDLAPLPVTLLFIGFIVGAIPTLYKQIHKKTLRWHHFLVFAGAALLMLSVLFLGEGQGNYEGFWYHVSVVFVGFIYAIAMIIPGLSGATMLIAFGFYDVIPNILKAFAESVISLDFASFFSQLPVVLLLIAGAVVGIVIMGKIMAGFMKKYPEHFIAAVLGIVVVSPINILILLQREYESNVFDKPWYIFVISGVLFMIGVILTLLLEKKNSRKEGELND